MSKPYTDCNLCHSTPINSKPRRNIVLTITSIEHALDECGIVGAQGYAAC